MTAADALDILVDPDNLLQDTVTVPEGLRVSTSSTILAEKTEFSKAGLRQGARRTPTALGLPAYAKGNPEGYLFPSTYPFGPTEKPIDMLKAMVDRWQQAADEAGLEEAADEARQHARPS